MVKSKPFRMFLSLAFATTTCVWMLSCETDGDCASIYTSSLKVQFLDSGTFQERLLLFDSVFAIGNDSVFYNALSSTQSFFEMPVNPFADTTAFVFVGKDRLDSVSVDTLVISYNILENIASPLCGVEQTFTDLLVTFTTYDSLVLTSDSLLLNNERNIEIFN